MNEETKIKIERAAEADVRALTARILKESDRIGAHQGPEVAISWENLPGTDGEVLVITVIVRDHFSKPFLGRAYLRPHELDCFDFEAGFLIASSKAYRQMADSLKKKGLVKVRAIFAQYDKARKKHDELIDLGMKTLEEVSRDSPTISTHDARLQDALKNHRVYICDECHKPYNPEEHRMWTWKGTLYVCPHCYNVVPKYTLKDLEEGAKVMPDDELAKIVIERMEGRRRWVEHKDGTITEELVDQVPELIGTCKDCGKEFKRPNADPEFDGYCPEHRPEVLRSPNKEEVISLGTEVSRRRANVAARVMAKTLPPEPEPPEVVKAYTGIVGAMAPVGMEYMPEGIKPSEALTVELGKITTTCVQCKKDLEREPDDASNLCLTCKEGGWMNMDDGLWHLFKYWRDPKGVKWDMFQSVCQKYLKHPEKVLVKDKNMDEEEPTCLICLTAAKVEREKSLEV